MEDISAENKKLSEPLAQAQSEVQELQYKLQNFEKDKRSLKLSRARLLVLDNTLKSMTTQHEEMEKRFAEVEGERDNLYATFEDTVLSVQRRSEAKNTLLEKKLDSFTERYERKRTQFNEVLKAANLDSQVVGNLTGKLAAVLDSKNAQIKNLRFDIARATKVLWTSSPPALLSSHPAMTGAR
jgi:chromosome segregation ATPase